jgi:hypothetical protein
MDSLFDTLWSDSAFAAIDNNVVVPDFTSSLPAAEGPFEEPFASSFNIDPMETSPARTSPPAVMFETLIEEDFFDPVEASWENVSTIEQNVENEKEPEQQPIHNTRSKRIKLENPDEPPQQDDDDSDYVYEYKRKTSLKRKSTKSPPTVKRSPKKPKTMKKEEVSSDGNEQTSCCLEGCNNCVTNRLRFSLRGQCTFKQDFLDMGWNKVCLTI